MNDRPVDALGVSGALGMWSRMRRAREEKAKAKAAGAPMDDQPKGVTGTVKECSPAMAPVPPLRIPVDPVPLRADAGGLPGKVFCHSIELSRLLGLGAARRAPHTWEVALDRRFLDARKGSATEGQTEWATQWLPVTVDDRMPQWGLWDVLAFWQQRAIPNPPPTETDSSVASSNESDHDARRDGSRNRGDGCHVTGPMFNKAGTPAGVERCLSAGLGCCSFPVCMCPSDQPNGQAPPKLAGPVRRVEVRASDLECNEQAQGKCIFPDCACTIKPGWEWARRNIS